MNKIYAPSPWKAVPGPFIHDSDGRDVLASYKASTHPDCELLASAPTLLAENSALKARVAELETALRHISSLWPMPPNCADILQVNGINDGKSRAILINAALEISRAALGAAKP